MKHFSLLALLTISSLTLAGCEIVGGIFKAGVWVGVVLVVLVIAIIAWIVSKRRA